MNKEEIKITLELMSEILDSIRKIQDAMKEYIYNLENQD